MYQSSKGNSGANPFSLFKLSNINRIIILIAVLIFFVTPVLRLIWMSFQGEQGLSLIHYQDMLSQKRTWTVFQNTIIMVLGSTALATILGVGFAWIIAYTDIRFKSFIQLLIFFPFVIPSYVSSLAWVQFFRKGGLFQKFFELMNREAPQINLYSMGGIIFVMGITTFPLVYLFTVNAFRQISRDSEIAARTSGASRWTSFRKITVPMALPGIAGGIFIAFLSSLDNFGIPAFLGTPANITVMTTYIYQQVIGFGPTAFNKAAVLSVILGVVALLGMGLQWFVTRKSQRLETEKIDLTPRYYLGSKKVILETFVFLFFIITSVLPLISMFVSPLIRAIGLDFAPENLTLKNYEYILNSSSTQEAIFVSLRLAGIATIIILFLGTIFAYYRVRKGTSLTKFIEASITLPYALPGTVFALSMIFAWMQPIPGWNPGIYGSISILYIAYVTRFMILQVRSSVTAFQQLDVSIEEAASISGSNGWGKWKKILIPLILPTVLSGSVLVFLSALTELTVSSLLYSSNSETIGVSILSFQQSGYTLYATAFSSLIVILIIAVYAIYFIFQWLLGRRN